MIGDKMKVFCLVGGFVIFMLVVLKRIDISNWLGKNWSELGSFIVRL